MATISGCSAYINGYLAPLGLPLVVECSGVGDLSSLAEVRKTASEALKTLGDMLGTGELQAVYSEKELIGRTFNLHKFKVVSGVNEVGHLRVAELAGTFINVSGVLYTQGLALVEPAVLERLRGGARVKAGENVGIRYAEERCSELESGEPVGQKSIPKFIIYAAEGSIPRIDPSSWSLTLRSPDGRQAILSLKELRDMSTELGAMDFHCVTGWSVRRRRYFGLTLDRLFVKAFGGLGDASWLVAISATGYTSVIPTEVLRSTALVLGIDGKDLSPENGYPARLLNPELYGWKGAKWITSLELVKDYVDGYWEALAYHERGRVAFNERFKIRNPEIRDLCAGSAQSLQRQGPAS